MSNAKLILGDALEEMGRLAPVDCVICDLPYGTTANSWDKALPMAPLWEALGRVCPTGPIVLTAHQLFTGLLIASAPHLFRYKWVWEKSKATNFLNAKRQPLRAHEDICVFGGRDYYPQMGAGRPYSKGVRKDAVTGSYGAFQPVEVRSSGARYPRDVVYFATAEGEGPVVHGTQKPVALMDYLVKTYSAEGDTVLDMTMGAGTTGVAALRAGRSFVGIEKDPHIFNIAQSRIQEFDHATS